MRKIQGKDCFEEIRYYLAGITLISEIKKYILLNRDVYLASAIYCEKNLKILRNF